MTKYKILFVCYGNICRSPVAEMVMKQLISDYNIDYIEVSSRGTSNEEEGNDIYPNSKETLKKNNITYTKHYAKQLKKEDYNYYDAIIGMERSNINDIKEIIGEDKENKVRLLVKNYDIEDPWGKRNFDKAFEEIYQGCKVLLEELK